MADFLAWAEIDAHIEEAINEYRKIRSGIHISMLATNRSGKTTLATGGGNPGHGILGHFENALILDTTADPGPISSYGKPVKKWSAIKGHQRLTVGDMSTASRDKVIKWINKAVKQGNVAIYGDEIRQLSDKKYFNLGAMLDHLWLFGAKHGTSLIGGTQAPLWVPGAFYDQAKLHFLFKIRDERRMKRLAEIGGDTQTLREILPTLGKYEFAFVDLDGDVYRSRFEIPRKKTEQEKKLRLTQERQPSSVKVRHTSTRGRVNVTR